MDKTTKTRRAAIQSRLGNPIRSRVGAPSKPGTGAMVFVRLPEGTTKAQIDRAFTPEQRGTILTAALTTKTQAVAKVV